jgi:hypothetical protein
MMEEEKKLPRLDKRLLENLDFDDQALNLSGFGIDIYYDGCNSPTGCRKTPTRNLPWTLL